MPDRLKKLKTLVQELEQELTTLNPKDVEATRLLKNASDQIDAAIHGDDTQTWTSSDVAEQLSEALTDFETRHPTLTAVVNRIAEALGQLGI